MFTINIKGKANPKDPKMVKLEMIILKTGYPRVTKVLNVSGPIKDWNNQAQAFKGNGSILTAKNKILFELKNQYQKLAEDWDYENRICLRLNYPTALTKFKLAKKRLNRSLFFR